jgi:hypothetical protein
MPWTHAGARHPPFSGSTRSFSGSMGLAPQLDLHFDVADTIFTVDPNSKRWGEYFTARHF